jgi:hypothetical protein
VSGLPASAVSAPASRALIVATAPHRPPARRRVEASPAWQPPPRAYSLEFLKHHTT